MAKTTTSNSNYDQHDKHLYTTLTDPGGCTQEHICIESLLDQELTSPPEALVHELIEYAKHVL